ncbi:hypothetical protein ACH4S8_44355 [Streptomyces sp. NPDC021080]|uniref:hypothetical protein n=1 Tax=Streptomyces sp. NPDC021080 TaxID=3365110 RepID=UPI0037AA9D5B
MAVVLALTACAVLTGATSLLAVGEWIADAPAHVLHRLSLLGTNPGSFDRIQDRVRRHRTPSASRMRCT